MTCICKDEQEVETREDVVRQVLEIGFSRAKCRETELQTDFNEKMLLSLNVVDVSEIYSPPRVIRFAKQYGLVGGWSLDLTTHDEHGRQWDFSKEEMRNRAMEKINKDELTLVIGSPVCTNFSPMVNANWGNLKEEEKHKRISDARVHLNFCIEVYKAQHKAGRYFLHEHPLAATSWQEPGIMVLENSEGVIRTKVHMCRFGMTQHTNEGYKFVKKPK